MDTKGRMWMEDPAKQWMHGYRCSIWADYMKELLPIIHKNGIIWKYIVKKFKYGSTLPFASIPLRPYGPHPFLSEMLCVVLEDEVVIPQSLSHFGQRRNIIDRDVLTMEKGDLMLNFRVFDEKNAGRTYSVYTSLLHLEELCALFRFKKVAWNSFGMLLVINWEMWDRLKNKNPFFIDEQEQT